MSMAEFEAQFKKLPLNALAHIRLVLNGFVTSGVDSAIAGPERSKRL